MKTLKSLTAAALIVIAAPFAATAQSEATAVNNSAPGMKTDGAAATGMSEGEVRKIDRDAGKITLKHGEIRNLGMPGMTMVFKVKDAALLDKVQVGNKVRFTAESADGAIVVTAMEAAM